MVRTFIGIEIENTVISEISQELSYLKNQFPNINWIRPENIHITLKYLGNVEPNDLRKVFSEIAKIGLSEAPFSLEIESTGVLPDLRRPKVVYAGCGFGGNELISLQNKIAKTCDTLGYPFEKKPYTPHITLGRIKKPSYALGIDDIILDMNNIDFGISDVDEIIVYMSELTSTGAEYSPMHRVRLEG